MLASIASPASTGLDRHPPPVADPCAWVGIIGTFRGNNYVVSGCVGKRRQPAVPAACVAATALHPAAWGSRAVGEASAVPQPSPCAVPTPWAPQVTYPFHDSPDEAVKV